MTCWSTLPKNLLLQIGDSLESPIDDLRFRSVCYAWRSTIRSQPDLFPIIPKSDKSFRIWGFCLVKLPIYRISIPPDPNSDEDACNWIVKISKDRLCRMELINPLSADRFKPQQPWNLDLLKFRVYELGHEYVPPSFDMSFINLHTVYGETVAVRQVGCAAVNFEYLRIIFGGLEMCKSGDKKQMVMKRHHSPYVQVKLFKGKFYAIDLSGNIVVVESGLRIEHITDSVSGAMVKCLVESCGDLLLVEACTYSGDYDGDDDDNEDGDNDDDDRDYCFLDDDSDSISGDDGEKTETFPGRFFRLLNEGSIRFKVYKLVENEKKWEEIESLGDQVLFLGQDCTFSVSAAGISRLEGNCIYAINRRKIGIHIVMGKTGDSQATGVAVYHLDSGKTEFLTTESKRWKLFWPLTSWVSNTIGGQEGLVQ